VGVATQMLDRRAERVALDGHLDAVRAGRGGVLVVRGDAGIGKTMLLDYAAEAADGVQVVRVTGIESELELAFAVLHQLCTPILDRLSLLPEPQRLALETAFGQRSGPAPAQFLVGLGVLSLLSEAALRRPVVCLVDDGHFMDGASIRALGFVARRILAEPVLLVIAVREPGTELAGLPNLAVGGLPDTSARELLASVVRRPLDEMVRERLLGEARGNPLALLELPRDSSVADLAQGFRVSRPPELASRIQESFRRQILRLPEATRLLLNIAAADPVGDPARVWQAGRRLGVPAEAVIPAVEAGLIEFATWVRFRHPLVRSAAYQAVSLGQQQAAHRALADVTDPLADPDRHAWHRAQAAPGPDEGVAEALAGSARRAQGRGGLAAAAAFRHRAAMLTPDPAIRARRMLDAARAHRDAGDLPAALELLSAVDAGPPDEQRGAEAQHLRGQVVYEQRRGREGTELLLGAARRLEPYDPGLAREAYLQAIGAALWSGEDGHPGILRRIAAAARTAPSGPAPARAGDVLLDALAIRVTEGPVAAVPAMTQAVRQILAVDLGAGLDVGRFLWLAGYRAGGLAAAELWDDDTWHTLAARQVEVARRAGAMVQLQYALNFLAWTHLESGDLNTASHLLDEDRLIADAIGGAPVAFGTLAITAWRGDERLATELIAAALQRATALGLGRLRSIADNACAVLHNGLGNHEAARDAARRAFDRDEVGFDMFVLTELAEAASRTRDTDLLTAVLDRVSTRAGAVGTQWALGTEALVRALAGGDDADGCFRESVDRLGRTRMRARLARANLLYGEWLRRQRRRVDARRHLRLAYGMLSSMGANGFAERARRELLATGENVRRRVPDAIAAELTEQETQIALLAREGLSNPEISTRLFISPRTVEWHLSHIYTKLGIRSRRQLRGVLPDGVARALRL
jgi:DNA-binding CsgD family transcriptional regulator